MVARMAYRCTFKFSESSSSPTPRTPVFSYSPKANAMLVCLRFQIQAFVTSYAGYIFDSAIGANFDSYLERISDRDNDKDIMARIQVNAEQEHDVTSVFALRDLHSQLLDRILSGCLLRTAQRAAGDALRDLLDVVLQFGALVVDLRGGAVGESEGAQRVEEVYWLFRKKMFRFVRDALLFLMLAACN
jgi:hypothetical protein